MSLDAYKNKYHGFDPNTVISDFMCNILLVLAKRGRRRPATAWGKLNEISDRAC